jgi:hypothetical protein
LPTVQWRPLSPINFFKAIKKSEIGISIYESLP